MVDGEAPAVVSRAAEVGAAAEEASEGHEVGVAEGVRRGVAEVASLEAVGEAVAVEGLKGAIYIMCFRWRGWVGAIYHHYAPYATGRGSASSIKRNQVRPGMSWGLGLATKALLEGLWVFRCCI